MAEMTEFRKVDVAAGEDTAGPAFAIGQSLAAPLLYRRCDPAELPFRKGKPCRLLIPKLPSTATVAHGRDGWKCDLPDGPARDAHAWKADIYCLRPRYPALCLFKHRRWQLNGQRSIFIHEGGAVPQSGGSPRGSSGVV